jgi:hypothetical protein
MRVGFNETGGYPPEISGARMHSQLHRFALIAVSIATLGAVVAAGQKTGKGVSNPPASPQAKTPQPATLFTQGSITSIQASQMVITRTVRGKAEQVTFVLTPQTQRTGNLVAGSRVSVQYRAVDNQNIAAAVRELPPKATAKSGKTAYTPKSQN